MEAISTRYSQELAQGHWGQARLFDQRRTQRLVAAGQRILEHPEGSLPQKMGDEAALQGLYGLLACPDVRHENVLSPHRQQTLEAMAQQEQPVLLIHDATDLDYTHVAALQGQLGQIAGGRRWGYICHNSLAVTAQGQVLGLANQILHRRRTVPRPEAPAQRRQHPDRESRLWLQACQALGPAPGGRHYIDVCDRGADTYEFLAYELRQGRSFVIRCAKDRNLFGQDHVGVDRVYDQLFAYVRDLPRLGEYWVQVAAHAGPAAAHVPVAASAPAAPPRTARVQIAAGPVSLKVPHFVRGEAHERHLELWIIHVRELAPPAGQEALEWMLFTNLPCVSFAQAREKVGWYECRPVIEDYHKAMKTGLGIEQLQLREPQRLEPAIALLSVAAAVLLGLRNLARQPDTAQQPAEQVLSPLEVQVLSQWRYRELRELTVEQAFLAIARLGGYQGSHRRPPGWLVLWRGWMRLQDMVQGAQLAHALLARPGQRCDQS